MNQEQELHIKGYTGGAFLAENSEAYGMISAVMPLATDRVMVAVGGYAPDDGMQPPTFTVGMAGVDGLYEGLYRTLLSRTYANESILDMIFGQSEGRQTHPIARYCAALTEALTYQFLTEDGQTMDCKSCAEGLSAQVSAGLDGIRDVIRNLVGPRPGSERFFTVSMFACRVDKTAEHEYDVDIFTAGDFCLYLLDEQGMRPLWTRETEMMSWDDTCRLEGHRLHLTQTTPFALLLLSPSATEPGAAEQRGLSERPALIWRHRIRLEDQLVRLIASGVDLKDAADRIKHYYEGRNMSDDSAMGAMMIPYGDFESFKAQCLERSRRLEDMVALFPSGYDPDDIPERPSDDEAARTYVSVSLSTRPRLREKTAETLRLYAGKILHEGDDSAQPAVNEEGIRCLTYADVSEVYAVYERENLQDRAGVAANRRLLRELLSEHWMTLRPLLGVEAPSPQGAVSYNACLRLKRRISRLTAERKKMLKAVEQGLADSLDILKFQENDWIHGRGGDDLPLMWMDGIQRGVGDLISRARKNWTDASAEMRSLQAAYTQERDKLFDTDVNERDGIWKDTYRMILEGTLPKETWQTFESAVAEEKPGFVELLRMVMTLSHRNGTLRQRIENRAAERRALQTISEDETWQVECMLGALSGDPTWEEACANMVDGGFRSEFKAFIRRLQEERELIVRRQEVFETYRAMYETYMHT